MTMGRPPKPVEQKRLLGNPGKRRLPSTLAVLPMANGTPDPPESLGLEGRGLWGRAWAQGITWISPSSDRDLLIETCQIADDLAVAREVWRATRDPKHLAGVIALSKHLTENLSALAFTPVARTRIAVAEVKKSNALEDLIARRSNSK